MGARIAGVDEPVRSVDTSGARTVTLKNGAVAHRDHVGQNAVLQRSFSSVRDGVWNFVGNGLSNQSFIVAPDGVIAIDTGESVEEMREALRELRRHTDAPIAAVIYTHFHYVEGTRAIFDEGNHSSPLPIYGHPRITINRERIATEIAPAYVLGLIHQFGIFMPDSGPDALVNDGLGFFFRNPAHAPFTPGHVPVSNPFVDGEVVKIAGLSVQAFYAPSDSDDSLTLWFSELGVCVHNLIWPTLFNVFAIRGEEYRDSQVLLRGIDQLRSLHASYLVGTHGPAIVGADNVAEKSERYRDSIQFLWDQTVRGANKGLSTDELAATVRLPDLYDVDYLTSERYGIAEHHVRQIHNGIRGWFDGDESKLLPVEPGIRYDRLIEGFGGRAEVAQRVRTALDSDDVRWATELATWLARSTHGADEDNNLLATCLRTIAQRTPAANIRNWCLTRARHLDGTTPLTTLLRHRFTARNLSDAKLQHAVSTLRVLLDPQRADGVDAHVAFMVNDEVAGLHVRRGVAVPTLGEDASCTFSMDRAVFDSILCERQSLRDAIASGEVLVSGDRAAGVRALNSFELVSLHVE
jgi:alkyl sulfatase BDS1-like metallo-beta-lactamase superfamily hydrolase